MSNNDVIKKENIFDLSKLAPIERDHEIKKTASHIDIKTQAKLLVGFKELQKEDWDKLLINDHIRYLRKDGLFRKGGFFKNSWVGTHGKQKGKNCIQLSSNKSFKGTTWTICNSEIEKIWKLDHTTETNNTSNFQSIINKQQETIDYLHKNVDQLKINMFKINNEQKRIINLIKKLHKIPSR